MIIEIPSITWGKQIKPPKNAEKAVIHLYTVSTDLNQKIVLLDILSSHSMTIENNNPFSAFNWSFTIPQNTQWLIIIATIDFNFKNNDLYSSRKNTGAYLWAKKYDDPGQ